MYDIFGYYILEGKTPVQVDDVVTWGKWFETANRIVGDTRFPGARISTVFLGLPHLSNGSLFETMIFWDLEEDYCERYCTWEEAEEGHTRAIDWALDKMAEDRKYKRIMQELGLTIQDSLGGEDNG